LNYEGLYVGGGPGSRTCNPGATWQTIHPETGVVSVCFGNMLLK
jgi:hypothetical protein